MTDYPTTELNPVRRLQILAATIPGSIYHETTLRAPHEQVWALVSDMDTSMPMLFRNFRSWQTIERDGERLRAAALGYLGLRSVFDVILRPGLCIMQDRRFVGGLAAASNPDGTRFALLAAPRGPARHLGALLRPLVPQLLRLTTRRLDAHLTENHRPRSKPTTADS